MARGRKAQQTVLPPFRRRQVDPQTVAGRVAEHQFFVERNVVTSMEVVMDQIDRYLNTVASALPDEQKEDIIRELSEDIRSEIEDRENQAGRSLNEAELRAV